MNELVIYFETEAEYLQFITLSGLLQLPFVWLSTQAKDMYRILCVTTVPQFAYILTVVLLSLQWLWNLILAVYYLPLVIYCYLPLDLADFYFNLSPRITHLRQMFRKTNTSHALLCIRTGWISGGKKRWSPAGITAKYHPKRFSWVWNLIFYFRPFPKQLSWLDCLAGSSEDFEPT